MLMSSSSRSIFLSQKSESEQETSMVPLKLIVIILYSQQMNRLISNKFPFSSEVTAYTRRGRHRPPLSIPVGSNISGFQLLNCRYYKDFDLTHLQFLNKDNQSTINQLQCSEENNTLSMIFKTKNIPKPGMNYALQKLLQCGSKKYPVRNLPLEMGRRSFSQLGHPQTTDDYLMFSFNSPIIKDFNNLFNVYCSMLFDPLMREQDFYEVIRRLTYEGDSLGFTGELASELHQGQFGLDQTIYSIISESLLQQKSQSLCKPLELLNIGYGELIKYYKQTITLPNCHMVLHGDINIHSFIDQCSKNFEEFKPNTHSPIFYPANPLAKQPKKTINFEHLRQESILMLSFKVDNPTAQEQTLLQILSYLLFDMPESPFLKFNTPETPYPNLYGYHQRYFNIGITFVPPQFQHMESAEAFKQRERMLIQKQSQLFVTLKEIAVHKLNDKMIEKCLLHLQHNYYERRGMKIIESITEKVINGDSLEHAFEVTALITKLIKTYRKNNIFEELLRKFILDNQDYIVLRGFNNPDIIELEDNRNRALLAQMQLSLPTSKLTELAAYNSPNLLQDFSRLPEINPNQLQFFEDTAGEPIKIADIKTVYSPRHHSNRFTFKFDLTDIGQDDIPLLALFCKAYPQMGLKNVNDNAYSALLQTYISRLDMNYECIKGQNGQLKIQLYLTIEFTDRNYEHAFHIINGLLYDFNPKNLSALSKVIHLSASSCYNELSEDILHFHGLHLAASKSPYLFFESPIHQARTLCGLAAEMKKVLNPKRYLSALGSKMQEIWEKMMGWSRVELLWECRPERKDFYRKHLSILLSQMKTEGIPPAGIDVSGFPKEKWQKYYPNYENNLVFEAFSVPYRQPNSPQVLVLSSIINENIQTFNKVGGSFVYKGALISFIGGTRTKFLELEDHYKKISNIDVAKRKIFQRFDRYTVENQFKSSIGFAQARSFKEAVLAVEKDQVEKVLNDFVLSEIKAGNSSVLCLGNRLENYQPLIKKGWEIERSIDDLSLNMESLSKQQIRFTPERYVDIC